MTLSVRWKKCKIVRLKMSMTVCQKIESPGVLIAITRQAIFCAEKMQDFQNPYSDWRAAYLKVQTNGLAKYYNISRRGGAGGMSP